MRQLWIFVFLAGMGSAMIAGQQVPPPPPPPPATQAQAPQSAQPAQQPAATTATQPGQAVQQQLPVAPAVSGQQPGMTQPAQTMPQPAPPVQQQPPTQATVPSPQTQPVQQQPPPTAPAPGQQPGMAQPAQTVPQPAPPVQQAPAGTAAPVAQPVQPVQQLPPPAVPAVTGQQPGMTQPAQTGTPPTQPVQQQPPTQATVPSPQTQPVQQPTQQPTQPTVPQMPAAQPPPPGPQSQAAREAQERWQLEQEAARQEAIEDAQETAQRAQQKADKAREEAQKQQAKANAAKQKVESLQGGGPLPQADQPDMTEAEYKREFLETREKDLRRLSASYEVMKEITSSQMGISPDLIRKSKCIVIIPATKRAAFVIGANYGRGAMTCRLGDNFNGPWSAPTMMALEGGSFGLQIGVQGTDWVLLIMNERGVNSLLSTKGKLGVDASIAAGPWGRNALASADLAMRAEILSFSHAHGIYLGASLDGSSLRPDNDGNIALYGRRLNPRDIVRSGEIRVPAEAVPLTNYLFQVSTAVVDVPEAPGKEDSK